MTKNLISRFGVFLVLLIAVVAFVASPILASATNDTDVGIELSTLKASTDFGYQTNLQADTTGADLAYNLHYQYESDLLLNTKNKSLDYRPYINSVSTKHRVRCWQSESAMLSNLIKTIKSRPIKIPEPRIG